MGIYINEVGYLPNATKRATVLDAGEYRLINSDNKQVIATYNSIYKIKDDTSADECYIVDFSDITSDGKYYIEGASGEVSATFEISVNVYDKLIKAMSKCLYLQRCGIELEEKYAGPYKHACCHTNTVIHLEDYLNKNPNPQTFEINGGWHDAGDFGRYTSPAAVAVAHLLYAFEMFPDQMNYGFNIPESGNGVPDILNEARYELEWMLKMQAEDGGVYHKLTAFNHADFIMPEDDHDRFIIYPVSSMATADFAACMALAYRVYKKYDSVFADKMLNAAIKAFDWTENNGYIGFHNPEGSNTGEYDDICDEDERLWAAAELLRTDKINDSAKYKSALDKYMASNVSKTDFGWTDVSGFALMSILTDSEKSAGEDIYNEMKEILQKESDRLVTVMNDSGYELAMEAEDFVWGSNMVVANRAMLLTIASIILGKDVYTSAVMNQLNYLLGRNALGRSYITGFGEHAFKNPHNRTSACDNVEEPMPGWVSGGPFKTPCDPDALSIIKPGTPPMKCHADLVGSYSTNEITIYWNSPVIFITAFINGSI